MIDRRELKYRIDRIREENKSYRKTDITDKIDLTVIAVFWFFFGVFVGVIIGCAT